ncbi:MAG: hypothetical protein ACTSUE_12320 [Promethearchaeota archaeon]
MVEISNPMLYGLYFIEIFINFELFAFFVMKWLQEKKERHISVLGLSYLFLGIARIFLIPWDFAGADDYYYNLSSSFAFLAMMVFMYASETLLQISKYPIFVFLYLGLAISGAIFDYENVRILYYIFSPIMIVLLIGFLCILMSKTFGKVRKRFFLIFLGFIIYGSGYGLGAQFIKDAFSGPALDFYSVFVTSTVLFGLALTGLGFIGLPSLSEIHWADYLVHLYVFHIDTAACIYDENLLNAEKLKVKRQLEVDGGGEEDIPADLFSSGVVGVMGLIKEMVRSEKRLKVLDHEDKKILLEYGKKVSVALLTFRDLQIYHEKLNNYIKKIEEEFEKPLEKWDGEISRFKEGLFRLTKGSFRDQIDPNWWKVDFKRVKNKIKVYFSKSGKKKA